MNTFEAVIVAAFIALLISIGGGYELRILVDDRTENKLLKAEKANTKTVQDAFDLASAQWEKERAGYVAEKKNLTGRIRNEVKKPIYLTCTLPISGVQLYNDALIGGKAPGQSTH